MMYLKNIFLFLLVSLLPFTGASCQRTVSDVITKTKDKKIAGDLLNQLSSHNQLSICDLVVNAGVHFLETPYVPGTLEICDDEKLVINLSEVDCTTFVEYCLAFAGTIKTGSADIRDFYDQLKMIRYRDGNIEGYASRLHYFSDWIFENERQGIVSDITRQLGGVLIDKPIDFMSKHPENYPALKDDRVVMESMIRQEKLISARKRWYIPKELIFSISQHIESGDIIAITSKIDGLDIMHTAIAVKRDNDIHVLHASTKGKKVEISEKNLEEYISGIKLASGIMIARPR